MHLAGHDDGAGLPGKSHLPLQAARPTQASAVPEPYRVLVVDDDDAVRETLSDLLEDAGYLPLQAAGAQGALAILNKQAVHLLITDLSMPGDDGITLIRQAKLLCKGLPVILLTGYAEEQTAVSMIAGAQCHVLRKPVESAQLLSQIALLLEPN